MDLMECGIQPVLDCAKARSLTRREKNSENPITTTSEIRWAEDASESSSAGEEEKNTISSSEQTRHNCRLHISFIFKTFPQPFRIRF